LAVVPYAYRERIKMAPIRKSSERHQQGKRMDIIGINVGCGTSPCLRSGWENVDKSLNAHIRNIPGLRRCLGFLGLLPGAEERWPKKLRVHDIRKSLPYDNNSLLYVYSSHCFEHLYLDQAVKFLRECFRVLKPGGILRLAVPDLESYCREYLEAVQANGQTAQGELPADTFVRRLLMVREAAPRGIVDRWFKPVLGKHTIHCWVYDCQSLTAKFSEAGFINVRRCSYRESAIPDIEFLDLAEKASESLYVEGTKPIVGT
jgi:predicted SAM-dependent methyltransferase